MTKEDLEGDRIMGRISVTESVTLDGIMQGLGRVDEDTRSGFARGGWGAGYQDEVSMTFMGERMTGEGVMLFGRRTYEDMLGYWTAATDPNPFTQYLTQVQKYVVSRAPNPSTMKLDHPNSTLLTGEATHTVRDLKDRTDGNITILGSGELVRALHTAGMVDEYILQIHPIVLGQGTALFGAADRANLTLQRSVTTTTGVIIAQYSVTPVSSGSDEAESGDR
ncbi:dihydrofolate reductase family protein [Arthrobacter sp. TmT3-37]